MRARNSAGCPDSRCRRCGDERFSWGPLRPEGQEAAPLQQRVQHAFSSGAGHCCARDRSRHSAREGVRPAESAHGDRASDNGRVANAAIRNPGWIVLSHYRPDYPRHLLLSGLAGLPIDHAAGGIRRLATGKNHFATDGHRPARRESSGREQGPQRGCAYVRGGIHRCARELALADVDPRSAGIDCTMDPPLAFPARRISVFLWSGLGARAKSKRETMDQPRVDPDQELVKRTQSGDAGAFDELVIKYTPRLYGLVYNMTSNHEDTNDLLQDIFAKAYRAIRGFRGK